MESIRIAICAIIAVFPWVMAIRNALKISVKFTAVFITIVLVIVALSNSVESSPVPAEAIGLVGSGYLLAMLLYCLLGFAAWGACFLAGIYYEIKEEKKEKERYSKK